MRRTVVLLAFAGLLVACSDDGNSTSPATGPDSSAGIDIDTVLPEQCTPPPYTVVAQRDGERAAGSATFEVVGAAALPLPLVPDKAQTLTPAQVNEQGATTALLGSAAYLVGIGVLGLCLGILTRSMGSGLGILVTAILIAPGLGSLLLPEDWTSALDYLPSQAASAFTSIATGSGTMSAGTGVAVFSAWLAGAFGAAWTGLLARDV